MTDLHKIFVEEARNAATQKRMEEGATGQFLHFLRVLKGHGFEVKLNTIMDGAFLEIDVQCNNKNLVFLYERQVKGRITVAGSTRISALEQQVQIYKRRVKRSNMAYNKSHNQRQIKKLQDHMKISMSELEWCGFEKAAKALGQFVGEVAPFETEHILKDCGKIERPKTAQPVIIPRPQGK